MLPKVLTSQSPIGCSMLQKMYPSSSEHWAAMAHRLLKHRILIISYFGQCFFFVRIGDGEKTWVTHNPSSQHTYYKTPKGDAVEGTAVNIQPKVLWLTKDNSDVTVTFNFWTALSHDQLLCFPRSEKQGPWSILRAAVFIILKTKILVSVQKRYLLPTFLVCPWNCFYRKNRKLDWLG